MTVTGAAERWFLGEVDSRAETTLFCLPYAGSGASAFRGWGRAMAPHIGVRAVQLPGRENRFTDLPEVQPAAVADAIAGAVTGSYAIYGHSLGARLGYEVVRELAARGAPLPERLIVAGSAPPDLPNLGELRGISREPDDVLVERLVRLGGIGPEIVQSQELLELVLPAIRADFTWIDNYVWKPGPPLPVPITAVCGTTDGVSLPATGAGWSRHSSPDFRLRTVPGGHFFLHESFPALADTLRAELCADGAPTPGAPEADEIALWLGDLDAVPVEVTAIHRSRLGAGERRRVDAFRFERDRHRFVARCLLVQRVLGSLGLDLEGSIPTAPGGKPHLSGSELTISWAQSRGSLLIGIGRGAELGVDLERDVSLPDPSALADTALHPEEWEAWDRAADPERNSVLLGLWTAKEALLKGTGDGLRVEPSRLAFAADPAAGAWQLLHAPDAIDAAAWRVDALRLPGALGAVARAPQVRRLSIHSLQVQAEVCG